MKSLQRSLMTLLFVVANTGTAFAQSSEDLDRARALFADALKDQSAQSYAAAVDKLREVAKVKDTTQVEYRIATCLAALGQSVAAARAYDRAIALGPNAFDPDTDAVVQDAHDKRAALSPKIGVLDLGFPRSVSFVTLRIDQESVTATLPNTTTLVEPSRHHLHAEAAGMKPFEADVNVASGVTVHMDATFEPALAPTKPIDPTPAPAPFPTSSVVLLSTTGLLAGVAIASLGMRAADISALHAACPNDVCPVARQSELKGDRDQALVLGPLAGAFAIGAVLTGGLALIVWPRAHVRASSSFTAWSLGGSF